LANIFDIWLAEVLSDPIAADPSVSINYEARTDV
jgi:hypothetical protein